MTIGIAIPTYIKHIDKLKNLLDSIQQSTVKPDKVSVSCSSYIKEPILFDKYDFDLVINYHKEYKNPSSNRNSAAMSLDTDIISFIDGDDISHPQRCEYILRSFEMNKCLAIVHNYKLCSNIDLNFINERYGEILYSHEYVDTPGVVFPMNKNHLPYHNAHISILRSIYDIYQYNEDENIKYKEDSEYCNRLVKNGINISYIRNPLSIYIK